MKPFLEVMYKSLIRINTKVMTSPKLEILPGRQFQPDFTID